MLNLKQVAAAGFTVVLAGCLSVCLAGCGDQTGVAATWANGDIQEDAVTNYIENVRSMYGYSSDESGWETFLKNKTYDVSETSDLDELVDSEEKKSEEAKKDEGTVQDYRSYVIEQMVRNDVTEWEAARRNLEVTDEELDEAVETNKQAVEAQYMSGTFESILQRQGYKDLESYKEELKTELQVNKLEKEIVGHTSSEEEWDQDKWDKFVDGLMAYADLKINDMPSGLSYDPATTASDDADDSEDADSDDATADSKDTTAETTDSDDVADDDASDSQDSK